MTDRVAPDPALELEDFANAIALISQSPDGSCQFAISNFLDPECKTIGLYGILLSDFIDHIAMMYASQTGEKQEILRKRLLKHLATEEREKKRDARRGNLTGRYIRDSKLN